MPGSDCYFGDKSVAIHSSSTTRLTRANFTMATDGYAARPVQERDSGASPSSTTSTQRFEGAAARTIRGSMLTFIATVVGGFAL